MPTKTKTAPKKTATRKPATRKAAAKAAPKAPAKTAKTAPRKGGVIVKNPVLRSRARRILAKSGVAVESENGRLFADDLKRVREVVKQVQARAGSHGSKRFDD